MPSVRHIRALLRNRQLPTGDIRANRMLSVVTVRSEKAYARIIRVRPPELPEGVAFIDSSVLSARASLRIGGDTIPVLASDIVRYVGEPIGLLVGPDRETLLSLREDVRVIYEEFEPRFSITENSDIKPYQELTKTVGEVDEAFASADRVVEHNIRTGVQEHFYPDPHAAYARMREDGRMEIVCATQWPHHVRHTVAETTGIAQANIKVYAIEPGQSLEGKVWYPSLVASHAALASRSSGAPCLLMYDRGEDLLVSPKRPAAYLRYRAALDAQGHTLALDAAIRYDTGAYPVMTGETLRRLMVSALGLYTCKNARAHVAAYRTNSIPAAPTVAIDAPAWHAAELLAGAVIRKTHADPVAWKLRHMITPDSANHVGERPPGDIPASTLMEAATAESDFHRKFAAFELQRRNRDTILGKVEPARGIGLAFGSQGTGFSGRGEEGVGSMVRIELDEDGGAWLYNSCRSASAALQALWRTKIADALGLDIESVRLASCDTDTVPDSGPSMFSRAIGQQTRLIEQALVAVNSKRFQQPLPISATRSYRRPRSQPWDPEKQEGRPYSRRSFAAVVVEVEVDPIALEPTVRGTWIAIEAGAILDEPAALQTMRSTCNHALAWAARQPMTGGGLSRPLDGASGSNPPFKNEPPLWVRFLDGSARTGRQPCGIGDLPYTCIPAAFAQAIEQATGTRSTPLPARPSSIYQMLEQA